MRKYLAVFDDGHDYISVEFDSEYRAKSKLNEEDAYKALKKYSKRYGRKTHRVVQITRYDYY